MKGNSSSKFQFARASWIHSPKHGTCWTLGRHVSIFDEWTLSLAFPTFQQSIHLQPHSLSLSRCISHKYPSAPATHTFLRLLSFGIASTLSITGSAFSRRCRLWEAWKPRQKSEFSVKTQIQSHQKMSQRFQELERHLEHTKSQNNGG